MTFDVTRRLSLALIVAGCGTVSAAAQEAAPFYKGKTVTIVVGTSAGGGYDTYARLFGRHLGKHLPGEPTVIVSNMPGAGSNIAAAYVARVALKDGTFIAAPFAAQPLGPLLEDAGDLKYDPSKVNYLGTAMSDVFLCMVKPDAPATNFNDMFSREVIMGGTAESGSTGYLPLVLNNVLGTKFKVVFGYPGTREITMAMQKGEVHGMCGMNWSSMVSQYANMLQNKEVQVVAQEHAIGHPDMLKMGVPLTMSYAKTEEQRKILEIIYSQEVFARPYFVAAEVPAERLKVMRKAFLDTWKDPELVKEAEKMNLDVGATSGEEIQALLQKIYETPPEILKKAKDAIKLKR
jgi:tripartite-type tricarboxylate transporter receptor subunit TctC